MAVRLVTGGLEHEKTRCVAGLEVRFEEVCVVWQLSEGSEEQEWAAGV